MLNDGELEPVELTTDIITGALKYLYYQKTHEVFAKVKNCRTLYAVDPDFTVLKDSHHPVCHDEAMSIGIAGIQVKGLVIDREVTPIWNSDVVDYMLEWVSTFFDFEEQAILDKIPGKATKESIKYFKEAQTKMHAKFAHLDVKDFTIL